MITEDASVGFDLAGSRYVVDVSTGEVVVRPGSGTVVPAGLRPAPLSVVESSHSSPIGITGDKVTITEPEIKQDWLNITAPLSTRDQVQQVVEKFIGAGRKQDHGANTYHESMRWESGCLLAWSEGRAECWLSMNGDSCDLIIPERKLEFFRQLRDLGAKCTRIDIALDLPRSMISMEKVHAAAAAGQVVGFRRYEPHRPIKNMLTGELEGDQANFGRRGGDGSGRFVRVYDKGLETGGELDCIRLESELAGDVARDVFEVLSSAEDLETLQGHMSRMATGAIDFADRTGAHRHRERFDRLAWYDRIIKLVGQMRLTVSRVKPTLESSVAFIERSIPLIIARLELCLDHAGHCGHEIIGEFIQRLLTRGRDRLKWIGHQWPSDMRFDISSLIRPGRRLAIM